ncbi:hypothetical protein T492DRAFT_951413 [Pavlovales sp. CCMP2436]|nr:hypothetical protein T492DRAFT_951413 [Pavlovales sp. CCMP2436]
MPMLAPASCHNHPLFYDAATAVRDEAEKLAGKLRRAHALAERYCTLGAKMAAISSELVSELVGAADLFDSAGLSIALGVLADEEEVAAARPPKAQLATLAAALSRTSLASEMLTAQLRAIVSEPLRELLEDPDGLGAISSKHAELTAASHALHEVSLDTLRPGVGAGARPRASDLSKGAASATVAAKGAARGVGGMFSKLMERAGQGGSSGGVLSSVASQIDESLGRRCRYKLPLPCPRCRQSGSRHSGSRQQAQRCPRVHSQCPSLVSTPLCTSPSVIDQSLVVRFSLS